MQLVYATAYTDVHWKPGAFFWPKFSEFDSSRILARDRSLYWFTICARKNQRWMLWRRGSEIALGSCCAYAYSFDTCLVNSAVHKLSVSIRIRYPPASGSQTNKKQNKREVTDAKAAGLIVGQNPMKYSIILLLTASKMTDPLRYP